MAANDPSSTLKRPREDTQDEHQDSDSSSDDGFGPALPSEAPKKKKRKLPHEKLYLSALPQGQRYSKSLMHKDQLSFVTITPFTDFLITSSIDGVVKFWKKAAVGIESVKEFRAHLGEIRSVSVSQDGRSFATAGADKTVKIFDVSTFDLLAIIQLDSAAKAICYVHRRGASIPLLAVSNEASPEIKIFDGRGESQSPIHTISGLHKKSVNAIAYNNEYDCTISADENGMIEYWNPTTYEKPESVFKFKSSTDLFDFKKSKSLPTSITISPSGSQFATFSFPDRKVRIFDFPTGKLYRSYDESLSTLSDMQQAGTALHTLEPSDFTRRMAIERALDNHPTQKSKSNIIFDESSHFICYGSLLGIKVLNTLTNRVVRLYGIHEPFRALNMALYQGFPQKKQVTTLAMAAASANNPLLQEAEERDPLLVATGAGKPRFYMYTNETDISKPSRDVQNERPSSDDQASLALRNTNDSNGDAAPSSSGRSKNTHAIMHTTLGDIHLKLYPQLTPLAVQNFTTHARNGYYNSTIFHRIIPKFMIQGGDPLGDGTGGESAFPGGKEFKDEIRVEQGLKHKQFALAMANPGTKDSNASQFFIVTRGGGAGWLDGKHTVFGEVDTSGGMDGGSGSKNVVLKIEQGRIVKERRVEEVSIVSIDVL